MPPRPHRGHGRVRPTARVRGATVSDLPVLVAHRLGMWRDIGVHTEAAIRAHGPAYRRWARPRLRSGELEAVVAEVAGRVVASGAIWWMPAQPRPGTTFPRSPYILSMYTEPTHRGQHLASRLVRELLRRARRSGAFRVTLHASNQGRPVYERLGFEATNEMRKTVGRLPGRRRVRGAVRSRARAAPRR